MHSRDQSSGYKADGLCSKPNRKVSSSFCNVPPSVSVHALTWKCDCVNFKSGLHAYCLGHRHIYIASKLIYFRARLLIADWTTTVSNPGAIASKCMLRRWLVSVQLLTGYSVILTCCVTDNLLAVQASLCVKYAWPHVGHADVHYT